MQWARVHCTVSGRVQGVAFRASARRQARLLGLTGWVCNRTDGTVEILAEGERTALQQLVDWCHQGPPAARVTRVEVHWSVYAGDLAEFDILP
jgi:acylphosphatase